MQLSITEEVKNEIVESLLKDEVFLKFVGDSETLIDVLGQVLPLLEMPSEDPRHKDALGDLTRHLVMNRDWDADFLFKSRLPLAQLSDEQFINFVELLVSPKSNQDVDSIYYLVAFFNQYFEVLGYKLLLSGYEDKKPIFRLSLLSEGIKDIPKDIKQNSIPFYYVGMVNFSEKSENHKKPPKYPSFVLAKDNWDDLGSTTYHHLFYYENENSVTFIGGVRIMKRGEKSTKLPDDFFLLGPEYCSLGTEKDFYSRLQDAVVDDFISVLFALRDAAFFPAIFESFEDEEVFRESLLRDDSTERSARTVSYIFSGGDIEKRYDFEYSFKPSFADETTDIRFPFSSDGVIPRRIVSLIGKNGTGKTQLLASLANDLSDRGGSSFKPSTPIFGKVIAVSYSVFDTFKIPEGNASFNYKYCGLKRASGELMTEEELEKRFVETLQKIIARDRVSSMRDVLSDFMDEDTVGLIIENTIEDLEGKLHINLDGFVEAKKILSSGQTILLYIVAEILAELRYDSLLLFDEPETHLHPNAITQLMTVIYDLVEKFDSYCVIATHSPLIVQSIKSNSVYVTERDGGGFFVRKIGSESFGESLSTITDEIFNNKDVHKEYKKIINNLHENGKSYEDIVHALESDNVPLSLNAKMYIKNLAPLD